MNKKMTVVVVSLGVVAVLGFCKVSYTEQSKSSALSAAAKSRLQLGSAKAGAVLDAVKKARPMLAVDLGKVANSAAGRTLAEAIHNGALLKGATVIAACDEARNALRGAARLQAPSCTDTFNSIADEASCSTVDGLVEYFSEHLLGGRQNCQMYTWGSNGVGACGCGFDGCIVLQDDF